MNESAVEVKQPVVSKSFLVQMRARGQITLPSRLRQALRVVDGDVFTLVQLDSLLLLAPGRLMVPELADRITRLAEKRGLTVEALLQALCAKGRLWRLLTSIGMRRQRLMVGLRHQGQASAGSFFSMIANNPPVITSIRAHRLFFP